MQISSSAAAVLASLDNSRTSETEQEDEPTSPRCRTDDLPPSLPSPKGAQAAAVVRSLRAPRQLSFGGALHTSSDAALQLRSLYPSLDLASRLVARFPELAPVVLEFLAGIDVPVDLRDSVYRTAGVALPLPPDPYLFHQAGTVVALPPTQPLGDATMLRAALHKAWRTGDMRLFSINDASLEILVGNLASGVLRWDTPRQPQFIAGCAALLERAHELGEDVLDLSVAMLRAYGSTITQDKAVMAAVARLAARQNDPAPMLTLVPFGSDKLEQCPLYVEARRALEEQDSVDVRLSWRRDRRPPALQAAPLGTRDNQYMSYFNQEVPPNGSWSYHGTFPGDVPDSCVRDVSKGLHPIANRLEVIKDPLPVFMVYARAAELDQDRGFEGAAAREIRAYLSPGCVVPARYVSAKALPYLARMALAAGISLSNVHVLQDGKRVSLADHPAIPRFSEDPSVAARVKWLRETRFDAAMVPHVVGDRTLEASEIFAILAERCAAGTVQPLDVPFPESLLVPLLETWKHPIAFSVLAGMLLRVSEAQLESFLANHGVPAAKKTIIASYFKDCQRVDPSLWPYICADLAQSPPNVHTVAARLRLAMAPPGNNAAADLRAMFPGLHPDTLVSLVLERIATLSDPSARRPLFEGLRKLLESDDFATIDAAGIRHLDELGDHAVDAAAVKFAVAASETRPLLWARLETTLQSLGGLRAAGAAAHALKRLYEAERVSIGTVTALDKSERTSQASGQRASRAGHIRLGGLLVPLNTATDKDTAAIPREEHADLVLTATTQTNLRELAVAWKMRRPVLLEGPTSAGKTAAVRYMAWQTGTPYRRINLSYYSEVEDLVGRYVGGEKRYTEADLRAMKTERLWRIATQEYALELTEPDREGLIKSILVAQEKPRWVDGPVVKALKRGEIVLLDEINLARAAVLERLNSLFDDDGNLVLTEARNQVVRPHKDFRIFATMNPATYAGREQLSEAMRSRWNIVQAMDLTAIDLRQILLARYGERLPSKLISQMILAHRELARAADENRIGRKGGGVAFTLRNLFRVADRFLRFQGSMPDEYLMRREMNEVYGGGLFDPDDVKQFDDIMRVCMPYDGPSFYDSLTFSRTADGAQIGDVALRTLGCKHELVPTEDAAMLVLTARTRQVLYRISKALAMGENVALIGERASGKSAIAKMYAMLREQPYYRQMFSNATDTTQLIGGYDDQGWKDGLLLSAGRPANMPGVFVADELNIANPSVLERLNPVLDDERKVVLAEKEGEEIKLHPEFQFIASMNPPTAKYAGRQKLSKAMSNRFTVIYVPSLDDEAELREIARALAARYGVLQAAADKLVDLHVWVTGAFQDGGALADLGLPAAAVPVYSVRQLAEAVRSVHELSQDMPVDEAYMQAVESFYASMVPNRDACASILEQARNLAL